MWAASELSLDAPMAGWRPCGLAGSAIGIPCLLRRCHRHGRSDPVHSYPQMHMTPSVEDIIVRLSEASLRLDFLHQQKKVPGVNFRWGKARRLELSIAPRTCASPRSIHCECLSGSDFKFPYDLKNTLSGRREQEISDDRQARAVAARHSADLL